ncbi:MAG: NAD(P)H-hydrate dehydratase [Myxococcales bacterium]|nr:NAD(P)H-hydrate dehydratase [Myxococcales bacterium]
MKPVVTAEEMRALDRATMEEVGIPGLTLMETAGRGVTAAVLRARSRHGHVAVVCGPGNNGGDGFVVARVLRDHGVDAIAYLAAPRDAVKGDARAHLEILEKAGGLVRMIATPAQLDEVALAIAGAEVCVDALFGIGAVRPIEGHLAEVVGTINRARIVIAVDVPSGIDSDTGRAMGPAVNAHRTVTMGALKVGLASAPGFAACGEVEVCDIGIPAGVIATAGVKAGLVEERDVRAWLPRPAPLDHKGTRGHAVIVGGSPGMRGAGRLAAVAALRAGAGLSTLAAEGGADLTAVDSVMTKAIDVSVAELLRGMSAAVIGCGLGQGARARAWVGEVLAAGVPAVLDADALNLLAEDPTRLAGAAGPIVITPHPGEAARLLGPTCTAAEVEADRLAAARALAAKTRAIVVLKGARTIVCDGTLADDFCAINPTGGPALASGGSGDVLAGVIGGLLAQGVAAADAARAGVYVHGLAGERLGAVHGRGAVSADLGAAIASVIAQLARA